MGGQPCIRIIYSKYLGTCGHIRCRDHARARLSGYGRNILIYIYKNNNARFATCLRGTMQFTKFSTSGMYLQVDLLSGPCSSKLAGDFLLPSLALWANEMCWNVCPPGVGAEPTQQLAKDSLPTHYLRGIHSHIRQGRTVALIAAPAALSGRIPLHHIKTSAIRILKLYPPHYCPRRIWAAATAL